MTRLHVFESIKAIGLVALFLGFAYGWIELRTADAEIKERLSTNEKAIHELILNKEEYLKNHKKTHELQEKILRAVETKEKSP